MTKTDNRTAIQISVDNMRALVLAQDVGTFVGSEEALVAQLGCSRNTVRQAARLLEREGLLRVKRGTNGGYFAARPDAGTVEATVSAHLEAMDIDHHDVTVIASLLWGEAMRKAVEADRSEIERVANMLWDKVRAVRDTATFEDVRRVEMLFQSSIFDLSRSNYIRLIFEINMTFVSRNRPSMVEDDDSEAHRSFVRLWRDAKIMEVHALLEKDRDLANIASQYSRKIWQNRIAQRFPGSGRRS